MPMTQMTLLDALDHIDSAIKDRYGNVEPRRLEAPESTSYPIPVRAAQHVRWLVRESKRMVAEQPERREKIMRWLAFCQGWAWTTGLASIDDLKEANRPPDE